MNFAKKSISLVLAGVMAASSLLVGTTAFAAPTNFAPVGASTDQAYTANSSPKEQIDSEGYKHYDFDNYFSFTPSTTGTYLLKVDSNPMYESYDVNTGEYVYSPVYTPGSYRIDDADVTVYEDADMNKSVDSASTSLRATNYYYSQEDGYVVADQATMAYISGYTTMNLLAGKTYYIDAYADYNYYLVNGVLKTDYLGTAKFSITPVDWNLNVWTKTEEVQVPTPDGNEIYDVYKGLEVNALYTGAANDVVVPANIAGLAITDVYGTANKNITSLTLSNTVKSVSGFSNLKNLAAVNLANVEEIGSFANDPALTAITIPATVKSIPEDAFANDSALSSVALNYGIKSIGSYAFFNTALKGAVIPDSVKSIGSYAFGYVNNFNVNTVDPYDTTPVLADGFAMGGYANDIAYDYAAVNGITYCNMSAGCPHPYNVTTVEATLFNSGSKTSVCPLCGATSKKSLKKKTFKIKYLKGRKNAISIKATAKGIKGYQIQYSTSKKFSKKTTKTVNVKTTKSLSKTIKGLKSGKKYYVRVRATGVNAQGKKAYSKYTSVKSVKVK